MSKDKLPWTDKGEMIRVILERLEKASFREVKLVFWYVLKHCR